VGTCRDLVRDLCTMSLRGLHALGGYWHLLRMETSAVKMPAVARRQPRLPLTSVHVAVRHAAVGRG
jgi:hypothetical protein